MSALSTDQQFLYVLVGIAALVVILELAGPLIWGFRVEHDRLIGCFFGLPFYDIRFADLVTVRRDGSWERLIPRFVRPKSGYGWLRPVVIITSKTGFYRPERSRSVIPTGWSNSSRPTAPAPDPREDLISADVGSGPNLFPPTHDSG